MAEFKYAQTNKPMRVLFFFSGGASSMKAVLESPEHGKIYQVVGTFTNRPEERAAKGYAIAKDHDIRRFYIDPNLFPSREGFYKEVTSVVDDVGPDIVGFSGFLGKYSIIVDPFLSAYKNRIINVHPADLSIIAFLEGRKPWNVGRDGVKRNKKYVGDFDYKEAVKLIKSGWKKLYTGDDAVNMAAFFGESNACSTIHSVVEEEDMGSILVQSKKMPINTKFVDKMLGRNASDRVADYAHKLQERMKTECDGPAFCKALELLGTGRMGIDDDHATLDEEDLPYGGYQMG